MKISDRGIELIKGFEGCKLKAYKAVPTEKYWTIGYGHYGADIKEGMTITQAQADKYLKTDLEKFEKCVANTNLKLNQNQFDALVSFAYNCGPGNLSKLVAGRTLTQISDAILKYNKANGKVLTGLQRRREAERALFIETVSLVKDKKQGVLIAHASIDENKKIKDGKAGDQTGKEVCIREWYNKPWQYVIRFNTRAMAEKVAECMEQAANNDNIGYDQNQRNTLLTQARKVNFNVSKIKVKCETDCSGLVTVACIYAGIPESALVKSGNCATTRTLRQLLKLTGKVSIFSSIDYTQKTGRLVRGDILLSEGYHVAVVVKTEEAKKTNEELAREVLHGLWGNGAERKQRLMQAGYNYEEVQKEVNKLIHGSNIK